MSPSHSASSPETLPPAQLMPGRPHRLHRYSRGPAMLVGVLVTVILAAAPIGCGEGSSGLPGPVHIASNITAFPLFESSNPIVPAAIITGSDGNLWFTLQATGKIGRITSGGVFMERALPAPQPLFGGIAAGHDGGIWLADMRTGTIWRLDPTSGAMKEFSLPQGDTPGDMSASPDGPIWVSLDNEQSFVPGGNIWIARIEPDTGAMYVFPVPHVNIFVNPPGSAPPRWLTPGPDGNVWFTIENSNDNGQLVGDITPAGEVKEFPTHGSPTAITEGPDGNLWFTNYDGTLARITPTGVISSFPFIAGGGLQPYGITTGPDHNLWITYETRTSYSWDSYVARISITPWE